MLKYCLQVHTEENKPYSVFKINPSELIRGFF